MGVLIKWSPEERILERCRSNTRLNLQKRRRTTKNCGSPLQCRNTPWVLQAPQCWEVRQLPWLICTSEHPSNENCKDSSLLRQIGNVQLQTWPLNWQGPHLNVWFCTELLRSIFVRKGSHVPRRQRATCLPKCQVNFTKRTSSVILHPMERGHEAPKLLSIVNVHSAQH